MKYFMIWIVATIIITASCDTIDKGDTNDTAIKPGLYELQAKRTEVGGKPFSASPVGGYFQQSIHFFKRDSLNINVKSDIPDENGRAMATYSVYGQKLMVSVNKSTTSYYSSGSSITFVSFQKVDSTFSHTFTSNSDSFEFHGPGLLLQSQQPETTDRDQDGNTTEIVRTTEYYHFSVRYD